jgi:hypothetical protein
MLLLKLDLAYGEGMHWRGQTPDWYVAAAMISSNIEDIRNEVPHIIENEITLDEAVYSRINRCE